MGLQMPCVLCSIRNRYTLTPAPRSYDNLEKTLGKQRRIDYITPDGNCLFRSLSKEILGHQKFHHLIRQYILEFMKEHEDAYVFGVKDHCKQMENLGEWGT